MIKFVRQKQGISLRKFAKKIKVSATYISKIEKGEFKASAKTLRKIELELELPPYSLCYMAKKLHPDIENWVWCNYDKIIMSLLIKKRGI